MSEAVQRQDNRLARWLAGLIAFATVALVVLALVFAWPWPKVGIALQCLGIMLAALGVPIIDPALRVIEARARRFGRTLRTWATTARERLRVRWARLRGRPVSYSKSGSSAVSVSASADLTVTYARVDRATVSDRDWLVHLDDRVYAQMDAMKGMEERLQQEVARLHRQLAEQRDDLQQQTIAITREGWEFILGGVILSFVGTALGLL